MKDAPIAEALIKDLTVLGYQAELSDDPRAVAQKIRGRPPAALIVEDRAARMNPVKVIQEIRRSAGRAFPAVVINNLQLASTVIDTMRAELGLGEVLTKPYSLDVLSKCLRTLGVPRGAAPATEELPSVTDYNSPQEVFYALLGRAVRTDGPSMVARERPDGGTYAYFKRRTLVAVTTRDPRDAGLARVLVRDGVLRADELPRNAPGPGGAAAPGASADKRLEELLLAKHTVDKDALTAAVARLAQERFQRLFGWRTGTTQIRAGEQPQNVTTVQLDVVPLILAGLGGHGDAGVIGRILGRLRHARLEVDKETTQPLKKYAANRHEASFLEMLAAHTVGRAVKLSGISEEAASIWLTYLRFIEDIAPREVGGASADPTGFALRLRRVEQGKERDAAEARAKEADREHAVGWKLLSSGHFEDASARFRRVIELDPSRAIAHVNLGWCLFRLLPDPRSAGVGAASERILEGLSKDPRLGVGYLYLGRIHAALGEVDHAARQYLKAIEVDPGNTEALEELRQIHLGREQRAPIASAGEAPAELPPSDGDRLALVVADWGRGTAPALSSAAKARLLAEVRDAGGSLEEFSFTRLSAVLHASDESRSSRLVAARLAVRLRDALQEIESQSGIGLAPRVAVVQTGSRFGDTSVDISEGLSRARPLLQIADTWQVVAEASMYRGLESLIDERRIPAHPDAVEVRASAQVIDALVASSTPAAVARTPWGTSVAAPPHYHNTGWLPAPMGPVPMSAALAPAPMHPAFTPWGSYPPPGYAPPYGAFGGYPAMTPPMGMPAVPLHGSMHGGLPPGAMHSGQHVHTLPPPMAPMHSMPSMPSGAEHSGFGTRSLQRSRLDPGTMLGTYRVEQLVGTGGMGEVYRATDLALLRPVAIKLMRRELLNSPMALRRFQQEAQALARINNPNVVQIYGVSMDTDPAWLVMEFVDGSSLRELLKDRGALPVRDVVDIALQTVNGLRVVFENGLIHRDVNPKNLLLTATGVVKITDFGMVKMDLTGPMGSVTHNVVGTPLYLAPEQAQGAPVDFRTDLYGLGVTVFHLVAGRPPFIGRTMAELLTKQILEPLPPLSAFCPDAPKSLVELVNKLAAKDPAERPATHREVAGTLEGILRELGEG